MKLHFFEPPAKQRTGGLDAAIESLRKAMRGAGIEVSGEPPARAGDGIAHFHGLWQPRHFRLSRKLRAQGIPFVVSPHGMLEPWAWRHKWWKKWSYFHIVEKRHLGSARALLATSAAEAQRLRSLFPKQRVEMLPLGVTCEAGPNYASAREQLGWSNTERVLLFLSRIHLKKGLHLLLQALAEMKVPEDTRLVIVGGGEAAYIGSLRKLAASLRHRPPRVEWIGEVWGDERWKYFQGADLFCLPTYSENFGLAVMESCQVGTPALTTSATPWATEFGSGRGFIATPDVASVREELRKFFALPAWTMTDRERLAHWVREKYHWDTLTPRYAEFYRSLMP